MTLSIFALNPQAKLNRQDQFNGISAQIRSRLRSAHPQPLVVALHKADPQCQSALHKQPVQNRDTGERTWTVYAQVVDELSELYAAFQSSIVKTLEPLLGDTRERQLADISSAADVQANKAAKQKASQSMLPSSTALALAALGGLVYGPLGLLAAPLYIYSSRDVHLRTWRNLKQKKVTPDTLVTITVVGCTAQGLFFAASLSAFLVRLSNNLMLRIKDDSQKSMIDVFRQHPTTVWVLIDGVECEKSFEALEIDDIVILQAGEVIPADGTIISGVATVDQHILTGEAQPVERGIGDLVFASTVVLAGRVQLRVEKTGQATTAAKIGQILNRTVDAKSLTQLRSEKWSNQTVVPTLLLGVAALPWIGPASALAIVDSHFKIKLSVITPLSALNFLNRAAKHLILIKDGRTLDLLNQVDTLVFDKTGTLTEEQPHIVSVHPCVGYSEVSVLAYAAAAEQRQTHPIARAMRQAATERQLILPVVEGAEYKVGYGLTVIIEQQRVLVGSRRLLESQGITLPPHLEAYQTLCHQQGHSLVFVAVGQQAMGAIELAPTVRSEAKAVIEQLRRQGKIRTLYIISGDHEAPTRKLAQELGIDHYFAQTLPEHKADLIAQLQTQGKFVCYVGDGINDAIALKKAQVSISLRGASTVATDTAQAILMDESLQQLPQLFELARDFHRNTNLCLSAVLIPMLIGMGGALFFHFTVLNTVILNQFAYAGGVSAAMLPVFRERRLAAQLPDKTKEDNPSLPNTSSRLHPPVQPKLVAS